MAEVLQMEQKMSMTSRQRVLATLNRRGVDYIPFDLGGTDCSSIHALAYQRLRDCLGLPEKQIMGGCQMQLIALLDNDVKDELGVDVEPLMFGSRETKMWKSPFGPEIIVPKLFNIEDLPDGSSVVKDSQGVVYSKRTADAYYFDPVGTPLAGVTSAEQLDRFDGLFERWDYSYIYDEPLEAMAERAKKQYESTDRAVIAQWRLHYLQAGQLMRGYSQFLMDLMVEKDLVRAMLEKLHQVYLKRIDSFFSAFGDYFDIVFLTDDLGTQQTGMISPTTYKEMLFPYMSEIVGKIKSAGKKVIMHSCGAVADFVPFIIEMGVDALNPVQVSAAGMNPRNLVRRFGKDIAFWGGGVDTQHVLNATDPKAVRAEVRVRLDEYGSDASLVFTQVHNIQYDVPPENIIAMRDEFWKQTRGS